MTDPFGEVRVIVSPHSPRRLEVSVKLETPEKGQGAL